MKAAFLLALFPISGLASTAVQVSEPRALQQRGCTSFTSALTLEPLCCDDLTHSLFWVNKLLGLGICCILGELLDGFTCAAPPPPPSAGVCSGESVVSYRWSYFLPFLVT